MHRGKLEQPELSEKRLGDALGDEHDARRPTAALVAGEPAHRFWILEAPGVRLEHAEQHLVVGGEAERHEHRRLAGVDPCEVHRGASEVDAGGDDPAAGFDRLGILGDENLELLQALDFVPAECQFHPRFNGATRMPRVGAIRAC